MIAYSSESIFQIRLPAGDNQTSLINILFIIRDLFDCKIEINISSIHVIIDTETINEFINLVENTSIATMSNQLVQLLSSQNQNIIAQIIILLSQQFNKMNNENINNAISSKEKLISSFYSYLDILDGIPISSISISPLGSQTFEQVIVLNK